jgi:hypothetical protein
MVVRTAGEVVISAECSRTEVLCRLMLLAGNGGLSAWWMMADRHDCDITLKRVVEEHTIHVLHEIFQFCRGLVARKYVEAMRK